jgi:hypothetical protein
MMPSREGISAEGRWRRVDEEDRLTRQMLVLLRLLNLLELSCTGSYLLCEILDEEAEEVGQAVEP